MNAITKTITGGIVATAAMTVITMVAPMMGMPKMNIPQMLAGMLGGSIVLGWMMHLIIGITFAFAYVYLLNNRLKIANNLFRGAIYGAIVFVFAQIMMAGMGIVGLMPPSPSGIMPLMIVGSLMGHLVYGIVLGAFVARVTAESKARFA
jgi:uncharacterized membrane protein YagU involved in acid resistance